jgi:hypothetical protein
LLHLHQNYSFSFCFILSMFFMFLLEFLQSPRYFVPKDESHDTQQDVGVAWVFPKVLVPNIGDQDCGGQKCYFGETLKKHMFKLVYINFQYHNPTFPRSFREHARNSQAVLVPSKSFEKIH